MKTFAIAASIWGRRFKILSIEITEEMKTEKKVKIKITDSYGIGYAAGKEYDVSPGEAAKLIESKKAVPVTEPKKENAKAKTAKVEKR